MAADFRVEQMRRGPTTNVSDFYQ